MFMLLRRRNFALLWFAGLISIAGNWVLFIGLPMYVYQLSGSTLATSAMFVAGIVPRLALGSVAGVFVDRWDRRRTMIAANLLMGLGLLPLFVVRSVEWLWVVYLVAFIQACLSQFFGPAENAFLPELVDAEHLLNANALNSLNNNLARLLGPPLGGFIAAWGGLSGIALTDAASFFIAALLIGLLDVKRRPRSMSDRLSDRLWRRVWNELLDGLGVVAHQRLLAVIFGLLAIMALGEGVFGVLIVAFVSTALDGGAQELGWLMSAQAVGGLLGGLYVSKISRLVSPIHLIGLGSIIFGLIDLAIFNYPAINPSLWIGIVLFVLVGIPGIWSHTAMQTLIQSTVPDGYLGRVFGALNTVMALMSLLGTLLAGVAGDRLGIITVLNVQGGGYICAGLLALALLRRVRAELRPIELRDGLC